MRLRLLLLFYFVAIAALPIESSFIDNKWVNVFKSFFDKKESVAEDKSDHPLDDKHARAKRGVFASLGAAINCEPGYTGMFCESPICNSMNVPPTMKQQDTRTIDQVVLRQGCAPNFHTFPLDSNAQYLFIWISMDNGAPNIALINQNGRTIPPDGFAYATEHGYFGFSWTNDPTTGVLPGLYQLNVTSNVTNTNYCEVVVRAITGLDVDVGFVSRPHEDFFTPGLALNVPQYVVVHPHWLYYPGTINAIYIYENERDHYRYAATLQKRYGCGYEYYAGEFTCIPGNKYRWVVEGVDNAGYLWRRSSEQSAQIESRGTFSCLEVPVSSTTAVSPTQPTMCMNGGSLIKQPDGTNICYCREFFTGGMCENALCTGCLNQIIRF